ncbi:MAG: glycosyltransferase family 2 protein [Acidobacteria bacterium]|nr:glycosyltransferase family 2 protein [Acidobacteriota bacterium]
MVPDWFVTLLHDTDLVILWYSFLVNSFFALLLLLAAPQLFAHWRFGAEDVLTRSLTSSALPRVSILVPAHNEAASVVDSLRSLLTLQYPYYEVVLINDGSTDDSLQRLKDAYDLYEVPPAVMRRLRTERVRAYYRSRTWSKLLVVDKTNGGKADSLNVGLDAARFPYVLACDADTLIEPDALLRLARPFLFNQRIAAVGGTIRVVNSCKVEDGRVTDARVDSRWLAGIQTVEYLRAFLFGRLGWNLLGGNLIISGAFGLFRRDYLTEILGYATSTVTEDFELIVRLQRHLKENAIEASVVFIPDPVAWTEVPTSVAVLGRQRERWHRGLIATMVTHRRLIFNPRYGATGMLAMPYFLFAELLAPLVEAVGLVITVFGSAFGLLAPTYAIAFFVVAYLYGSTLSLASILMEEVSFHRYRNKSDTVRLVMFAFLEPFGYRQLTVWFRLKAFVRYVRGDVSWGRMKREGFGVEEANPARVSLAQATVSAGSRPRV